MKSYKIHIIRAGQSEGILAGRYVGRTQSPLSTSAITDLCRLKGEFSYPQAEFFCASPSLACVDSLKILYPQADPEVVLDLAECDFGDWENKTAEELKDNPHFSLWLAGQENPPGGESSQVFFTRICKGFQLLVENLMFRGLTESLLVTTAGVMTSLLSAYGLPRAQPQDWMCDPGFGYSLRITPSLWTRQPVMEVFDRCPKEK